jgi:hypothetical protein
MVKQEISGMKTTGKEAWELRICLCLYIPTVWVEAVFTPIVKPTYACNVKMTKITLQPMHGTKDGMKEWGMAGMASLKLHCCLSTLHDVRWSCLGGHHEMGKNCVQENWSVSLEPRCCSWKVGTRRDEESVTDIIKRMDAKPIYVCNVKVTKITLQPRIVRKWCSEDCLRLLHSMFEL